MKKLTLIFIAHAMLSISSAFAQKGSLLVGGNIQYSSNKIQTGNNHVRSSNFELSPLIGYQFHQNMTAGIKSSYSVENTEVNDRITALKIGGFFRYARPLDKKNLFSVYGDLAAGYKSSETNLNSNESSDILFDGFFIELTPAIFINLKRGFGLNFNIGGLSYEHLENTNSTIANNTKNFDFNFGKTFSIGISKNF